MSKKQKRSDRDANNAIIRDAFIKILQEKKGRRPTMREISEKTSISITSVKTHLKTFDFRDLAGDVSMFKILTDDMILSIYRAGMKGNAASQKLWFQIIENWSEKTETKLSGKVEIENKPPVILNITRAETIGTKADLKLNR